MPSSAAQLSNIRAVYKEAGLDVDQTAYVECHGTGTPAGDPKESFAVSQAFCENRDGDKPILIGSIKPNIGHLEGAAGVAGLIKAVLAVERGQIPKNLYFDPSIGNPDIKFDEWKVKVSKPQRSNETMQTTKRRRVDYVRCLTPFLSSLGSHFSHTLAGGWSKASKCQLLWLWRHKRTSHSRRCRCLPFPAVARGQPSVCCQCHGLSRSHAEAEDVSDNPTDPHLISREGWNRENCLGPCAFH